jgi:hypothetical protein
MAILSVFKGRVKLKKGNLKYPGLNGKVSPDARLIFEFRADEAHLSETVCLIEKRENLIFQPLPARRKASEAFYLIKFDDGDMKRQVYLMKAC